MENRDGIAMQSTYAFEERCLRAVRELREASPVELEYEYAAEAHAEPGDVDATLRNLAAERGVNLEAVLRHGFFSPREVHVQWRMDDHPTLGGEFQLHNMIDSLSHPEYVPEDLNLAPHEQEVMFDLRAVDSVTHLGIGAVAGIRLAAGPPFEMWFYDNSQHSLVKLDIGLTDYLDTVLATKGAAGWQYLFADVDFRVPWMMEVGNELQMILSLFPEIFPHYDYAPLRARLEERL